MEELVDLTRDLVSIPSHDGEVAAGDRIETWLRSETTATVNRDAAGAQAPAADPVDGDRGGNVIARKGDGDQTLGLIGHHDVVPPADSQLCSDGTGSVVERTENGERRLFGRGTADMKGAVAAAMVAFRDATPPPETELLFASFVGEESGGIGARHAIERGVVPEYAVVGEGSTGYSGTDVTDVVIVHRGRRASTVIAEGTAAHASEPAAGDNAIYLATDAVQTLRSLEVPETRISAADATVEGSLAVTMIDGGTAWNVIPDSCEITVDERTVPGDDETIRGASLNRLADDDITVRRDQDWPPMRLAGREFRQAVLRAATDAQSATPQPVVKPHATDAGWLSQAGTECVVCGPAELGQAHTDDESVAVSALETCYRIYRQLASDFTGS